MPEPDPTGLNGHEDPEDHQAADLSLPSDIDSGGATVNGEYNGGGAAVNGEYHGAELPTPSPQAASSQVLAEPETTQADGSVPVFIVPLLLLLLLLLALYAIRRMLQKMKKRDQSSSTPDQAS